MRFLKALGMSFLFLFPLMVLSLGCSSDSGSPTSPPAATATFTNTLCVNASNTPCTSTDTPTPTDSSTPTSTRTPTFSPTATFTATPSNTPTVTMTRTPTFTPTDSSTPTFTRTSTFSATPTSTATSSHTPTATMTRTSTFTPTSTPTLTNTSTITDTPTDTNTRTVTNTPTLTNTGTLVPTSTFTNTPSSTSTKTNTSVPTNTPTATNTVLACASTATFTFTPSGANYLAVTVHVSSGTVNSTHPIFVHTDNSSLQSPGTQFEGNVNLTANNASVTFSGVPSSGTDSQCMVVAFFDPNNAVNAFAQNQGTINVGGYYVGWNGSSTGTCNFGSLTNVTAGALGTGVSLFLNISGCRVYGLSGAVSYVGSGTVDHCHTINIQLSTNGSSFANFNANMISNKPGVPYPSYSGASQRFDMVPNPQYIGGGDPTSYYLRAYYDSNGNAGWTTPPSSGEPCVQAGPFSVTNVSQGTVTFSIPASGGNCGN